MAQQLDQVKTYPSDIWDGGSKTFVPNVNREQSSDDLTTVAVKDTNEVLGFQDGTSVDEMEHAINGRLNGVIKPYKPSFYERNIQEPLSKLGMSSFQPQFITDIKPSAERAFVTSFARGATADIIKPNFSEKEAAAYPAQAFAGQLAGTIAGMKGIGVLLDGLKLPAFAKYATQVIPGLEKATKAAGIAGKAGKAATTAIQGAIEGGATAGAYRAVSETSNEIKDSEHPDLSKIGKAVLHDTLWWGGISGTISPLPKFTGVATAAGLGYAMAKADGASEADALLNGGILGGFHLVSAHGDTQKVRDFAVDNLTKNIGDYIQAKNPLVDDHVAIQAGREMIYSKAEEALQSLKDTNLGMIDKEGKPLKIDTEATGQQAVNEILKNQETTVDLIKGLSGDVMKSETDNTLSAAGETPEQIATNKETLMKQLDISRSDAIARGDEKAVARLDKLIEKNQPPIEIPEFKSTEEAIAFGEKHKDNPKVLEDLKKNRADIQAQYKKLSEDPNATPEQEREAFRLAQVAQFPREALEAAAGKISKTQATKAIDKIKNQGNDFDNEAKKLGYKIDLIDKKPKDFYGKHFPDKKVIEVYTKGRTQEQINDTILHELGHAHDYIRRGIVADPMGDSIMGNNNELRPAMDSDVYFRQEYLKSEAEKIRKEIPRSDGAGTTQKEIYADAYKLFKKSPDRLMEIAPNIFKDIQEFSNKLSSESGQANIPGVDQAADITKEAINILSPRSFVPKPALDKIMEMKGGQDRAGFELGARLEDVRKEMDNWSKEDQVAFVDNIKRGLPQKTEALTKLAETMRTVEDNYWKEAKQYKDSLVYKENHYRVLWKVIPGSKEAGAGGEKGFKGLFRRPLQGTKGFAKQSTLESMSEGIAMGGEPYSYNPVKMWMDGIVDMQKFITAQRMFRGMKDMDYAKFVKTGGKIPDGFVRLNDNIAQVYFPTEQGMVKTGEYYIEENVGRILNNFISKDFVRSSSIGKSLLDLKNITTSVELSLSPFHAAYVSLSTASASVGLGVQKIINRAILQQKPAAFLDGLKDIVLSGISPAEYAKTGGRAIDFVAKENFINTDAGKEFIKEYPDAKQLMEDLFTGGGKLAMHQDYKINSLQAFKDGIKNKEPWAVAWNSIPAANELIMKPLFEQYIPRLKIGTFLKEYSLELAQRQQELVNGSLTRPELARRVWDSVENRLGEMNFDNLFWDRTFKSGLQLMFRSVTWKIGALKNIGVSIPEQIAEIKNAYDQGRAPLLTGNMGWLLGVATLASAFSYVTMGMTGQGKPKDLKDMIAPRYDKEGNRISLNTHIKDWVHLWHNPAQFITNSLSGEIGRTIDLWNNKDFYGVEIHHPDDLALTQAIDSLKYLIPVPFSVSNQMKLKGDEAPNVLKATTLAGITQPSPGYISNTPAEETAHEINRAGLPVGSRTKEEFQKSELKKQMRLDYARTGDTNPLDEAVDNGKISSRERKAIIKAAESSTMERLTGNMTYNDVLKVMGKANPEELKDLVSVFNRKVDKKIRDADTSEERDTLRELRDKTNEKYGNPEND